MQALLAVEFHFRGALLQHALRPVKFPMDTVIFHGGHAARGVPARPVPGSTVNWWRAASCPNDDAVA